MIIGGYLLRCYTKINPQRAKSTPPVNFCSRLVSISPIIKSVGDTAHLLRHTVKKCPQRIKDTPVVLFLPYSLYLHHLFQKAYGEYVLRYAAENAQRIRTDTDVSGSKQQQVFR